MSSIPSMAAWRCEALELFPDLQHQINSRDRVYQLFFSLLPMAFKAHRVRLAHGLELLARVP